VLKSVLSVECMFASRSGY